jgi:peptidoglycan lytic transglycosylase A
MTTRRPLTLCLLFVLVAACSQTRPPEKEPETDYGRPLPFGASALVRIDDPAEMPDCRAAFQARTGLIDAVERSIEYMTKPSSHLYFPRSGITHIRTEASLVAFRDLLKSAPDAEAFQGALRRDFAFFRSYGYDGEGSVFVTAYCTPIYDASLTRTARFTHPLYRLPPEIVKAQDGTPLGTRTPSGDIGPSPTRAEIEEQGLYAGRDLELCWLENPVDAYVIHVQGSGKLRLPDGRMFHVGYAGKTEHPYGSVGRALVAEGRIPPGKLSLMRMRRYFADHRAEVESWLRRNPSYVFFQEYPAGMPHGSLGFPVTPYRSIATDKSLFPRASVVFMDVDVPASGPKGVGRRRFASFVLDQDTGGAIRAAGRADLYFGVGAEAENLAGRQSSVGRMIYIFLKN